MMKFLKMSGQDARSYAEQLASLRLKVFWEFPYLYDGTIEYEKQYLETYFRSSNSFILLIQDEGKIVGATTGIPATEEEENFRKPFLEYGLDPASVFYFGESVLLPEYRGKGLGKLFFKEREMYAKSLPGIKYLSFCAVERSCEHRLIPPQYRPLNDFWQRMGFHKERGLTTSYSWKDRDEAMESLKTMQFWLKNITEK